MALQQEVKGTIAKFQSSLDAERRQRMAFGDELRTDIQQLVQSSEMRTVAAVESMQGEGW